MRFLITFILLTILGLGVAFAQQAIVICIPVTNPFGGAPSCVPISSTNPLPAITK